MQTVCYRSAFIVKEMIHQKIETVELCQGLGKVSADHSTTFDLRNENESLKKELGNMQLIQSEVAYLRQADDANKKLIIELIEKLSRASEAPACSSMWMAPKNPVRQSQVTGVQMVYH